ncbi:peptidase S24 [Microbacterium sp. CH12i]|uniref:LexA family protein n=1 Tax=Microbacterium sp. CH12i TaxID=1479651 RepID=UPI000460C7DA|nr:translesion error-prone DNA polymerase V autoproteolytic subunit [Microbacterium sp. CH12i]KDA04519.1 peptidase S24 [Microbacterium sp. CH12i]
MAMTVVPLYAYPVSVSPIQLGQLLDAVPAGFPSPGQDWDAGPIDLTELLIDDQAATFLVRITGTSMIGAGIYDGDVAIVDRSKSPRSGDVVVAILDGDFTIKRLLRERGTWALRAENAEWPDVVVDELSTLEIFGVVTVSMRFHRSRR